MRFILTVAMSLWCAVAWGQKSPIYNTNTYALTPSNIFPANVLAGTGVTIATSAVGRVTISASGGGIASNAIANADGLGTNTSIYGWLLSSGVQTQRNSLVLEGTSAGLALQINTNQFIMTNNQIGIGVNAGSISSRLDVNGAVTFRSVVTNRNNMHLNADAVYEIFGDTARPSTIRSYDLDAKQNLFVQSGSFLNTLWASNTVHALTTLNVGQSLRSDSGYFTNGVTNASLTASRPMLTDANKMLASGQIDLSSANHVTGTLADGSIPSAITRDPEWDTAAEINTATTDDDFVLLATAQNITASKAFTAATTNHTTWRGTNIFNGGNMTNAGSITILGTSSNAVAYMTNHCIDVRNTNEIYGIGAGAANANGKYVLKSSVDPTIIWTNANAFGIVFDTDIGSPWDITNAAGAMQYSKVATDLESGTWVNTGGGNPVPTTLYGTNQVCVQYLVVNGLPLPYDNIWHVKTNSFASDITAVKGNPGLPCATVTNALARCSPGDIVLAWPGVHNWGATDMGMSNSVKLIGFGRGVSVITNAVGVNRYLELGNNCVIEGISGTMVPSAGQVSASAKTNWSIINCDFEGASDGLLMPAWQGPVRLVNSRFASAFDGIAESATAALGGGTNTDLYIIGCEISGINAGGATQARGLVLNSAKAKIVGSTITARNGQGSPASTTPIVIPTTATNVAWVNLVGTSLLYDSTNGGVVIAISNGNANVTVSGQWTENGSNVVSSHRTLGATVLHGNTTATNIFNGGWSRTVGNGTNVGNLVVNGSLEVGSAATFLGNLEVDLTGNATFDNSTTHHGGLTSAGTVFSDAAWITNVLQIPVAAAPTTDAAGEIAFDNNAHASGRGAVQAFDGTANTWLVGVLSSDTPSNLQVPTWNTGGTVTWETAGGGYPLILAHGATSPGDGNQQTYGAPHAPQPLAIGSGTNHLKVIAPRSGTITRWDSLKYISTTVATTELITNILVVNFTTVLSNLVSVHLTSTNITQTGLSIPVTAGQVIWIKADHPTYATNPVGLSSWDQLWIE